MTETKIISTPADEALWAFDQTNNVDPTRTIAERIAGNHGFGWRHPMVDEISHALEDARDIGRRRAPLEIESARSHAKQGTT
jgi:hypothetical protein